MCVGICVGIIIFYPTEGAKFEMYAHWPLNINVHLLPVSVGVGAKG